jgi:CDP-alcohol phosphatidyltransferase
MALLVPLKPSWMISNLARHGRIVVSRNGKVAKTTFLQTKPCNFDILRMYGSTINSSIVWGRRERRNRIQSSNSIRWFADATSHTTKNVTGVNVGHDAKAKDTHQKKNTIISAESKDSSEEDLTYEHFVEQLKSLPNIITTTRMISSPLLSYWVITNQVEYAVMGCFIAAVSDVADGFIARNYNMKTTLGTYLDPLGMY